MLDPYAHYVMPRIVYGFVYDEKIVYVGSTSLPIEDLEYNHRNCKTRWPSQWEKQKDFRKDLYYNKLEGGYFKVLLSWECTKPQIESLEGKAIMAIRPKYNEDMDPVRSSKFYVRY